MEKNIFFSFVLFLLFVSCQNKQESKIIVKSTIPTHLNSLDVVINDTTLSSNFENVDFDNLPKMTKILYDSLQLSKIDFLKDYDLTYISMGRIILSNENGRILTVQVITDGEIIEYLISYDNRGKLIDGILVAYEDMVEYYSEVTSKIQSNSIIVQTVNFTYEEEGENAIETSDTIITKYEITPDFKFIPL